MKRNLPPEVRDIVTLLNSGCAITMTELGAMPQPQVERLLLVREVMRVIEYGLEVT